MADAPWRCSQCGTINEPAANSCRTCGRWPSLFDLEAGAVETKPEPADEAFPDEAASLPEPEYPDEAPYAEASPPPGEVAARTPGEDLPQPAPYGEGAREADEGAPAEPGGAGGSGTPWRGPEPSIPPAPAGTWVRRLSRLAIPLLILIYVLISSLRH